MPWRWHAKTRHPDRDWSTFLHRPYIKVLKATQRMRVDLRGWTCPLCKASLPKQGTRARTLAVTAHKIAAHPKIPMKKWRGAMMRQCHQNRPKPASVGRAARRRGAEARARKFPTHQLIEVPDLRESAKKYRRSSQWWCIECLTRLAGYGGGSRARLENLTCSQCKALPAPKQRMQRAWQHLQGKRDVEGNLVLPQASEWVRNLVEDGDIEPNPGPDAHHESHHELKVISANVASAKGMWTATRQISHEMCDVALLQETSLKKSQVEAFSRNAFAQGYRFFHQPGHETDRRGHRGCGILVNKHKRARQLKAWQTPDCQAIAVLVEGVVLVSVYDTFGGNNQDFFAALLEWLAVNRWHDTPWLLMGDWNAVPSQNQLAASLTREGAQVLAVVDEDGNLEPTRYQGKTAIDWGLCNLPRSFSKVRFEDLHIADHKVLACRVQTPLKHDQCQCILKLADPLSRPAAVALQNWHEHVTRAWHAQPGPRPPESFLTQAQVDAAWMAFTSALERALRSALAEVGQGPPGKQPRPISKDKIHLIHTHTGSGTCHQPESTFKERSLVHLVHRLYEMRRLEERGDHETAQFRALSRKVRKWEQLGAGTTAEKLQVARRWLDEQRNHDERKRIEKWRLRMRESPKACYRWLADNQTTPALSVNSSRVPHLGTSHNAKGVLEILTAHWRHVWDTPSSWEQHSEDLMRFCPSFGELGVSPLSTQDLLAVAGRMKGKAASVDGWLGDELAELPEPLVDVVAEWFRFFEHSGKIPSVWNYAKQVHIPKCAANDQGSLDAAKLRPITVLSCFYRWWSTGRLQTPEVQHWVGTWWPEQACGGRRGKDVFSALGSIVSLCDEENYLVGLDLSLAFDRLQPRLVDALMARTGLPQALRQLLMNVWTAQKRVLVYAGQAHPDVQLVSGSLPQGDAWSMVGMCLALVPATQDISVRFPRTTLRTFVDDRCFVAPSAEEALQVRDAWHVWSRMIGVQENVDKAALRGAGSRRCPGDHPSQGSWCGTAAEGAQGLHA